MQLGDILGFAGIAVGLGGGGLALAYPTKRWIGFTMLGCGLLTCLIWAVVWLCESPESAKIVPKITWIPASLKADSPLTESQLNAIVTDDSGSGVETECEYKPSLGTRLAAGTQTLSVLCVAKDPKYGTVSKIVTLQVEGTSDYLTLGNKPHNVKTKPRLPSVSIVSTTMPERGVAGKSLTLQFNLQTNDLGNEPLKIKMFTETAYLTTESDRRRASEQSENSLFDFMISDPSSANDETLSSSPTAHRAISLSSVPVTQERLDEWQQGVIFPYFLFKAIDIKRNRVLLEYCAFVTPDYKIAFCRDHNYP